MLALVLLFDKILGKETMGGGDLKLFVVMGLYLGVAVHPCLPCFFPVFSALLWELSRNGEKRTKDRRFPSDLPLHWRFMPCCCMGTC